MKTRVLVVDDSPTMRALLTRLLNSQPDLDVIGAASCAQEARVMIRERNPDVVTLDIEMPGMNGLDFLDKIMRLRPTPVVVVSGATRQGAAATIRALQLGAVDCYAKPDGSAMNLLDQDDGVLAEMVRSAARIKLWRNPAGKAAEQRDAHTEIRHGDIRHDDRRRGAVDAPTVMASAAVAGRQGIQLIAIGASTGGVEALHKILPAFPADCPPTIIVQHISAAFAPAMAEHLDRQCVASVQLAQAGLPLLPGHIYIAPGNERHTVLGKGSQLTAALMPGDPVSGHRPSVDMLFESVARQLGPAAVGIVLTGMGRDGARGLFTMRQAGAHTIAQDQQSCVVYGMPRAAADIGAAEKIVPLPHIAERALAVAGH